MDSSARNLSIQANEQQEWQQPSAAHILVDESFIPPAK